jgi:hypothetical protein
VTCGGSGKRSIKTCINKNVKSENFIIESSSKENRMENLKWKTNKN